jgi:prolyl-tRNA editing enzyme YbaK/EbsC (Cys-tRNA(Pro) deacylase)
VHPAATVAGMDDAVRRALDGLDTAYEVIDCDPDFADTGAFCERYGVPLDESANTIVVASKKEPKRYCACMVLATTRLDVNHTVCRLLEVNKASFAGADETREVTGMMIGGVTPFALPETLPLYIDERVMARDSVVIGGGDRSSKIRIAPQAFLQLPNATVVAQLANERAQADSG